LAELVGQVYGIEIVCPLADQARTRLAKLGYRNIILRCGDGYRGWPEHAPFDLIILAAAPEKVPQPLLDQLAPQGRLVLPIGGDVQQLIVYQRRSEGRFEKTTHGAVRFVPMTGEIRAAKPIVPHPTGSPPPEK
jgi:protein-L-isoaspartate(D-aspartate) O-methyltransferase